MEIQEGLEEIVEKVFIDSQGQLTIVLSGEYGLSVVHYLESHTVFKMTILGEGK